MVWLSWIGIWCWVMGPAGCDPVGLVSPQPGAVSQRVMQDLVWELMPEGTRFDLKVEWFDEDQQAFAPFLLYLDLLQEGKLTANGQATQNIFHPPWFLDELSLVQVSPGVFKEIAPVLYPGRLYRWSVRVSGQDPSCWVSREFTVEMDPAYRVGVNSHLTTPQEWWPQLGFQAPDQAQIEAYTADLLALEVPYVFEGMFQAWGREAFRDVEEARPRFWESDIFYDVLSTAPIEIISQSMFQPYRVRDDGSGGWLAPESGEDFFTLFDPLGEDAAYIDPSDYSVRPEFYFSRHDPRTRSVDLFSVSLDAAQLSWHDLFAYWDGIYCAYHAWRLDTDDPVKRQAILDAIEAYRADADQFMLSAKPAIQTAFSEYLAESVTRYGDRGMIWHFGNEPNGNWHIDPRLYAHLLAFFAEQVRMHDASARIMMASIFPGNPASVDGELFEAGYPDFWWISEFAAELGRMRDSGQLSQLPFDVAGINYYLIRDDQTRSDRLGVIEAGRGSSCVGNHVACPGLLEQECQFDLFAGFYRYFRDALDQLASDFSQSQVPIIVKETASVAGQADTIAQHLERGIAFVHELGYLDQTSAPRSPPQRIERINHRGLPSRIEAVLWFHYHLSNRTSLVDPNQFPQQVTPTPLWDAIWELNQPCAPRVVDAGPDRWVLCGVGQQIGSALSAYDQVQWWPQEGLSDPGIAQPVANPSVEMQYRMTVTNPCGQSSQDSVRVVPVPVFQTQHLEAWTLPVAPELDTHRNGFLDVGDYVWHTNSAAACPP